ncbi:hypothetical protein V498_05998 [Pseudogymnoascus sp. VKM F-4517 (FW-2822)]|nr:hypothetical protein V498_05998 [Pseudogymnoascus sp. VKM F-4517 (FW-2822)]
MNPPDTLCLRDLFVIVTLVDAYYVDPELARPIYHYLIVLSGKAGAIAGSLVNSHHKPFVGADALGGKQIMVMMDSPNGGDVFMVESVAENNGDGFMDPRAMHLPENGNGDIDFEEDDAANMSDISEHSIDSQALSPTVRKKYLPTGCCYDDRMKLHANADFSVEPSHPEDPRRIASIMRAFKEAKLVYNGDGEGLAEILKNSPTNSHKPSHPEDPRRIASIMRAFKDAKLVYDGDGEDLAEILKNSPTQFMYRIAARGATPEEICTVHTPEEIYTVHTALHFKWVADLSGMTSDELRSMSKALDNGRKSLYVGNYTYEAALIAAGGAIETCKNVVAGTVKNAIAVIRPPGHHAESDEALGFCMFNNVPVAARVCQADFPETCRKILILDWDVHHGNGIQNIFYDDPNVLYISLHVYIDGSFYPGFPDDPSVPDGGLGNVGATTTRMCYISLSMYGGLGNVGAGPGSGRNVNIPWHAQGMGDGEYLGAFQRIVMPIAQEFDPDLVIVSAGFDAADGDELGRCFVSPACYAHMTHMLMSLADGKVAVCLEGGYNLKAISRSALAVAKTLMGEPPGRIKMPPINKEALKVLHQVKEAQAPFWECMRPGKINLKEEEDTDGVRLNDVIRAYQHKILRQKYKMVDMHVTRDKLIKSLEYQVLITSEFATAKKILLIIHDPPELLAIPDPIDYSVEPHNSWMNDGLMAYIDWAVNNGYAVIDVNMPMHIDDSDANIEEEGFIERPTEMVHRERMKELMCFLWDNYLEVHESEHIVLMGVGDSYSAVRELLVNRESKHKVPLVVSFVSGSLRPVRSETDANLAHWYKKHSRVYVAADHLCWTDPELERKVRKSRFGRVVKSGVEGLNKMLRAHLPEVVGLLGSVGEEGEEE